MGTRGFFNPITGFNVQFPNETREGALRERILSAQEREGQRSERMASDKNSSNERIAADRNASMERIGTDENTSRLIQAIIAGKVSMSNAKEAADADRYRADKIGEAVKIKQAEQSGQITPSMRSAFMNRRAKWETNKKAYTEAKTLSDEINRMVTQKRDELDGATKRSLFGYGKEVPAYTDEQKARELKRLWSEIGKRYGSTRGIVMDPSTMTARPILEDPGEFDGVGEMSKIMGKIDTESLEPEMPQAPDLGGGGGVEPDGSGGSAAEAAPKKKSFILSIWGNPFILSSDGVKQMSRGDARRFNFPQPAPTRSPEPKAQRPIDPDRFNYRSPDPKREQSRKPL